MSLCACANETFSLRQDNDDSLTGIFFKREKTQSSYRAKNSINKQLDKPVDLCTLSFIIPGLRYRERVSAFVVYIEGKIFFSFKQRGKDEYVM